MDPSTFFAGNPAVRPALTDALQARYQFKKSYLFTLSYSQTDHQLARLVRMDPEKKRQYLYFDNLTTANTYSLSVNAPFTVTSWWQMQNNVSGYLVNNQTNLEGKMIQVTGRMSRINTTQTFKLPRDFSVELSGWYNTRSYFGITESIPVGSVGAGVRKKLPNDKGNLHVSI
jgi:hypothetical protein